MAEQTIERPMFQESERELKEHCTAIGWRVWLLARSHMYSDQFHKDAIERHLRGIDVLMKEAIGFDYDIRVVRHTPIERTEDAQG